MRVVLQRVSRAAVRIAGMEPAAIENGLLLLVGLERGDGPNQITWMADKIAGLRIFEDEQGLMNRALEDVGGRCLVVSQFTLLGDTRKGRRPSFVKAQDPDKAKPLFDEFCKLLAGRVGPVETGVFGARMDVELVNDGPVTLVLERPPPPE